MWTPLDKLHDYEDVFRKMNWEIAAHWIWNDTPTNFPSRKCHQALAFQVCFVATYGIASSSFLQPFDYTETTNHWINIPNVLSPWYGGDTTRVAEKPVQVALCLMERYSRPEGNILVLGSGEGSACIAGLYLMRKVWAVEDIKDRWKSCNARVRSFLNGRAAGDQYGNDPAFKKVALFMRRQEKKLTRRSKESSSSSQVPSKKKKLSSQSKEKLNATPAVPVEDAKVLLLTERTCVACGVNVPGRVAKPCDHCDLLLHVTSAADPSSSCGVKCPGCELSNICPRCVKETRKFHP